MVVKCVENKKNNMPLIIPVFLNNSINENNIVVSKEWYTIDGNQIGYNLTVDKDYLVYGIMIYLGDLRFLIADDNGTPGFFPANLFSMKDKTLVLDWEMGCFLIANEFAWIISYSAITQKYEKFRDLVNNCPAAIKEFLDYKNFCTTYM